MKIIILILSLASAAAAQSKSPVSDALREMVLYQAKISNSFRNIKFFRDFGR